MLALVASLVLAGPFAFNAKGGELSLKLPDDPPFCILLPEAPLDERACDNESVETIAHKRKQLAEAKTTALVATAAKGTLIITVHDLPAGARKGGPNAEVKRYLGDLSAREADEGRTMTFAAGEAMFELEQHNQVWTARADATHELPDGKWKEARWLVLTAHHTYDVLVQAVASSTVDVHLLGVSLIESLQVPPKARVELKPAGK